MMRWVRWGCLALAGLRCIADAQGTKLWSVDRYAEMARGMTEGVAIRSDGRLEAGPATSLVWATGGSYVWSLAGDAAGNAYVGIGGTTAGAGIVMKTTADGKATKIFESKELAVQALRLLPDGSLLAATSPDGKLYKVPRDGGAASVLFDPAATEEKPKYLWDVAEVGGTIFVAAGAPAAVYRIAPGGRAEVLFKTADQHIRCLLAGPDGTLWAGSDGGGVIYRIAALEPGARPFAVYAAPKREITALAIDPAGNVYAAGVGAKGPPPLPLLPVTGGVGVSVTFVAPGSTTATNTNVLVPEGSEIYRIAKDGAPSRLLALRDDVVYGLAYRRGALFAATGNRGRVYRVDTAVAGQFTDVAHLEATQAMAFAQVGDGLLLGTSNTGKVFKVRDRLTSPSMYTSPVFDAAGYAVWGRLEVRSSSPQASDLYVRSGNVESPLLGWSDWMKVGSDARAAGVPAGRYAQWKAVLRENGTVDAVALNYLQANLAPVVDEVVIQPGARVSAGSAPQPSTTVQIAFPAPSAMVSVPFDPGSSPITAQKDRTAVTARWSAHDDNGDDLMFAVFYKSVGEANWHLLRDKITDRYLSFDAALLPDGSYFLKVVASDAPVHTDADALKAEKVSELFVVDTTPPLIEALKLALEGAAIHVTAQAHDATSPIAHAEFSLDAGPWQYVEPAGKLSDAGTESYDFRASLPEPYTHASACGTTGNDQHVVAMRVYDRYENAVSAKAMVERACPAAQR